MPDDDSMLGQNLVDVRNEARREYQRGERIYVADTCSCGGIDAVPHATDHASDCSIWSEPSRAANSQEAPQ